MIGAVILGRASRLPVEASVHRLFYNLPLVQVTCFAASPRHNLRYLYPAWLIWKILLPKYALFAISLT